MPIGEWTAAKPASSLLNLSKPDTESNNLRLSHLPNDMDVDIAFFIHETGEERSAEKKVPKYPTIWTAHDNLCDVLIARDALNAVGDIEVGGRQ